MPDTTPAQELRAAAKRVRADAAWPAEDLHHALADWLAVTARHADADLVVGSGKLPAACRRCSGLLGEDCHCGWAQAIAVARAYPGMQAPVAPANPPRVVCLCGSTRFYGQFQQAYYDLTMKGEIVLSVGFYPHAKAEHGHGEGVGHDSAEKIALDELHKRKIDLADYVLVLNVGGYIGESTRGEIEYATAHGVPVEYLEATHA